MRGPLLSCIRYIILLPLEERETIPLWVATAVLKDESHLSAAGLTQIAALEALKAALAEHESGQPSAAPRRASNRIATESLR
jgi:hypothetical protein